MRTDRSEIFPSDSAYAVCSILKTGEPRGTESEQALPLVVEGVVALPIQIAFDHRPCECLGLVKEEHNRQLLVKQTCSKQVSCTLFSPHFPFHHASSFIMLTARAQPKEQITKQHEQHGKPQDAEVRPV
jgi:hypothetical protein